MCARILYLTPEDPTDKKSWSGIHYSMFNSILKMGHEVIAFERLKLRQIFVYRVINYISRKTLGRKFKWSHYPGLSKTYGRIYRKKILDLQPDIIFIPSSSAVAAHLDVNGIPIIFLSGGTFELLEEYYEAFSSLFKFSSRQGNSIESKAIKNADALIYPTKWAADSAINHYGANPQKTFIIPYGSNVDEVELKSKKRKLNRNKISLILVGVRWNDKGVPIAIDAVTELRKRGIDATLDICGCNSPDPMDIEGVTVHGFLDKRITNDADKLNLLYEKSDLFILPTRFENYGVSFVEAFAKGLPAIGTNTGGVSSIIQDGYNGYLLNVDDLGVHYADKIELILNSPHLYSELSKNAFNSYKNKFNWGIWGEEFNNVIVQILSTKDQPLEKLMKNG